MKNILSKNLLKITLLAALFSTLFFVSCNKDEELKPSKESIEKSGFDCDEEFDGVVNTAALGVVELAKNSSFRSLVHNSVAEQFDEDHEVLLRTLNSSMPGLSETMRQSVILHRNNIGLSPNLINYKNFQSFTTSEELTSVVTGFDNCGKMLYTQIYVPFFGEVNMNATPVIVIGYEETDDCIIPGYQIQQNGSIRVINVDENFARNNLVWVVSINERVDEDGIVFFQPVFGTNAEEESNDDIDFRVNDKIVKVDSVRISDKKECWLCGKAEVSFLSLQAINCTRQGNASAGYDFISIGSSDVNKWKDISPSNGLSYLVLAPENPLNATECIGFVLFEKDVAKNKWERSWTYWTCPTGGSVTLYYHSKQTPYGGSGAARYCYESFTNNPTWTQLPVFFSWGTADLRLEARKIN